MQIIYSTYLGMKTIAATLNCSFEFLKLFMDVNTWYIIPNVLLH